MVIQEWRNELLLDDPLKGLQKVANPWNPGIVRPFACLSMYIGSKKY